jgi:pyruvate carboxylase
LTFTGYGFLSENAKFAQACEDAGIIFVGPSVQVLKSLGDKTEAKLISKHAKVNCIPGSKGAIQSYEEAEAQVKEMGLPVMIKASMGGGGRGMRVVREMKDLKSSFESAGSEAKSFFGDGSVFIEKFIERPRHVCHFN